ncbi:MAG: 3-hydroxyacyl-ACP dehydratase FabZ [Clostridiales bacterium]|jgi:3-hydroxyacyl-[acyl-carrier-protein] dehydratase|nr:3-hydroxyacyl-ACP dehydratase FabZ [Clostridiales bacterium]
MIGIDEIKRALPQREPFLFLDSVSAIDGTGLTASYTFTPQSPVFQGHFPGNPVVPGVLMIEAMAQAGAYWLLSKPQYAGKNALLYSVNNARFKRMARPGDRLEIHIRAKEAKKIFEFCDAEIRIGGKIAVSCELGCIMVDDETKSNQ